MDDVQDEDTESGNSQETVLENAGAGGFEQEHSWFESSFIQLVNPRLYRYKEGCKLAGIIVILQFLLICLLVFIFRDLTQTIHSHVLYLDDANSEAYWKARPDLMVASSYVVVNHRDALSYSASPRWHGYNRSAMDLIIQQHGKLPRRYWHTMGALWKIPAVKHWADVLWDYDGRYYFNRTWYKWWNAQIKGHGKIACHLAPFNCSQYSARGVLAERLCDDEFVCSSFSGVVSVTEVRVSPYLVCIADAMALITYFEIATTGIIVSIYLCLVMGPCWCFHKEKVQEVSKVTFEKRSDLELQLLMHGR